MAYSDYGSGTDIYCNPGTCIAEHLVDSECGYARGPERALLSALLFDGVQAYMNYVCAAGNSVRTRYKEAYNWVNRQGEDYIFAFDSVCEALGIDPDFLRLGLLNACNSRAGSWRRSRRSG